MRKAIMLGFNAVSVTLLGSLGAPASAALFNDPPVAVDDTLSVRCHTFVSPDVLVNDSDPDNDALTIIAVTHTRNEGNVDIVNNGVEYEAGSPGTDTIIYTISDGHGGTDAATVAVTITGTACIE